MCAVFFELVTVCCGLLRCVLVYDDWLRWLWCAIVILFLIFYCNSVYIFVFVMCLLLGCIV